MCTSPKHCGYHSFKYEQVDLKGLHNLSFVYLLVFPDAFLHQLSPEKARVLQGKYGFAKGSPQPSLVYCESEKLSLVLRPTYKSLDQNVHKIT